MLTDSTQMFLVDNSRSMQQYEGAVIATVTGMAHILEKADEDGLDVTFTSNWNQTEHGRRAENLAAIVKSNFHKGDDTCFIEQGILALIDKVIEDLPSKEAKKGRALLNSFRRKKRGRPVSIYVLTNGIWNSSPDATNGVCGADRPIRRLIRKLQDSNLHKNQATLQFIRFGDDATGIKRLTSLDDDLGIEFPSLWVNPRVPPSLLPMLMGAAILTRGDPCSDIVDHKDGTGGVWPMLVGSLDEGVDRETNTPENNNV